METKKPLKLMRGSYNLTRKTIGHLKCIRSKDLYKMFWRKIPGSLSLRIHIEEAHFRCLAFNY